MPTIETFASAGAASRRAGQRIASVLRRRRPQTLVLASGQTMVPIYRELVRLHRLGRAPFRRARTFNLDELAVSPADPRSFRAFMERRLFSRVDLDPRRIHFLRGDASDAAAEGARYEAKLARHGPPDLALVGIGRNGHVAYLEPGRFLAPRASAVALSASTRRALAADGVQPVPRRAITMGIETILSARAILLVATGRSKAAAVAAALEGPVTARCPASFLSIHPKLIVVLDTAASMGLDGGRR
jgi:glucosamine-6-phosphate deaminase